MKFRSVIIGLGMLAAAGVASAGIAEAVSAATAGAVHPVVGTADVSSGPAGRVGTDMLCADPRANQHCGRWIG